MAGCYPCVQCKMQCQNDTIQCSNCCRWVHIHCVPMSSSQLKIWSQRLLSFLCRDCCFTDSEYDCSKALGRISRALNTKELKTVVSSESLLLETYNVQFHEKNTTQTNHIEDPVSKDILKLYHPAILAKVFPAKTVGDGNCLYRAVSRALTGSESYHVYLRLLTVIEIVQNPLFYDSSHRKFVDIIKDNRIICAPYLDLIQDAVSINSYATMCHIYALSAALSQPIRSYYPPQLSSEFVSEPHTRKVVGRGVQLSESPTVTLMWTQARWLSNSGTFFPNHFVPLISLNVSTENDIVIDCDASMSESEVDLGSHFTHVQDIDSESESESFRDIESESLSKTACQEDYDQISEKESEDKDIFVSEDVSENDSVADNISNFITNDSVHDLANGCIQNSFLEVNDLVDCLQNYTFSDAHPEIPPGIKNDVYFVVQNDTNTKKRSNGQKSSFPDDCGVWNTNTGSTPKTYYIRTQSGDLKNVFLKNGSICTQKKVKGKRIFVPLDPQPDPNTVLELCRYYTTLKCDSTYKKRVSWLSKGGEQNISVVEYLGTFPGLVPHGNARRKTEYIRTPSNVMEEMSDMLKTNKPMDVYNKLKVFGQKDRPKEKKNKRKNSHVQKN